MSWLIWLVILVIWLVKENNCLECFGLDVVICFVCLCMWLVDLLNCMVKIDVIDVVMIFCGVINDIRVCFWWVVLVLINFNSIEVGWMMSISSVMKIRFVDRMLRIWDGVMCFVSMMNRMLMRSICRCFLNLMMGLSLRLCWFVR